MSLSFSPGGTQIVLIGNTTCPHDSENLPDLPTVKNNVESLRRIFESEDIVGLDSACIETILDPASGSQLLTRLSRAAKKATDTLLIYYAGHGIKHASVDGLFLATAETTQEDCHLNGAEFNRVRQIIFDSTAAKKILIFDCCYSGEITAEEMGGNAPSALANNIQIRGTYSIASVPRNSLAYAPPQDKHTAFSNEFIRVLEDGVNDNVEFLTLDRIYDAVRSRVAANPKLPAPQRKVALDANEFVFAKNMGWASNAEVRIRRIEERFRVKLAETEERYRAKLADSEENHRIAASRIAELEARHESSMQKTSPEESFAINLIFRDWQGILLLLVPALGSIAAGIMANEMYRVLPGGADRKAHATVMVIGTVLVASILVPVGVLLAIQVKKYVWPRILLTHMGRFC